jgi:hypothetical protein
MRGILREALEGDKGLSSGIGNRFARATGSLGICGNMYLGLSVLLLGAKQSGVEHQILVAGIACETCEHVLPYSIGARSI